MSHMNAIVAAVKSNLSMMRPLVADVPPQRMCETFGTLKGHAAWQLGHLAVSMAFAGTLIGADVSLPEGWDKLFGIGSEPIPDASKNPGKEELLSQVEKITTAVVSQLTKTSEAAFAAAFPDEKFREVWPTVGDSVVFVVVSHFGFHLGCLSAWRRGIGLGKALPF